MKIITHTKGGVVNTRLDPDTDVVISIVDSSNKHPIFNPDLTLLLVEFDDVYDDALGSFERCISNNVKSEFALSMYARLFRSVWPCIPFTPYHARLIVDFARFASRGHEKNWHIHCEYGRSRSVSVAMFLTFLFPKHELVLQRDVARPNPRVYRILCKEYGII